jgi:hypothetical protein
VPTFTEVTPDAMRRLVNTSKGFQQRQVYRDNLLKLSDGKPLDVRPEGDETIRKIKVNLRRAANELGISVQYGETKEGTLLVWSAPRKDPSGRRGRPRKTTAS